MEPRPAPQETGPHQQPDDQLPDKENQRQPQSDAPHGGSGPYRAEGSELKLDETIRDGFSRSKRGIGQWISGLGIRSAFSVGLQESTYRLMRAWRDEGRIPDRALSDVIEAIYRGLQRVMVVVLAGGIIALLLILLLLRQNALMHRQISRQTEILDAYRRAELLATIYNRRDCDAEVITDCPLQAHARARAEAAVAFVADERTRAFNFEPDLSAADLSAGDLNGAQWYSITLTDAVLRGTSLARANLQDAYLSRANLQDANLGSADLRGAFLANANLRNAFLGDASLQGANLQDADLRGADLRGANLRRADLNESIFDETTHWPNGFDPLEAGAMLHEAGGNE